MTLRVACVQLAPYKAEVPRNLDRIADAIQQASDQGAQVVAFSETATSGYFLEGGVLECALSAPDLASELSKRLGDLKSEVGVLVGFYELLNGQVYSSAAFMMLGKGKSEIVHVYRKFFLATYGVFDEDRFIARGREIEAFDTPFGRFGILICEDVWHSIMPTVLALKGAQVIFVPSASPARGFTSESISNVDRYRRLLTAVSEEHSVFCVNAQLVGFEGGKGFVGGSCVIAPNGELLAEGPVQEEHILIGDLNLDTIGIARQANPLLADLEANLSEILDQLIVERSPTSTH